MKIKNNKQLTKKTPEESNPCLILVLLYSILHASVILIVGFRL